VCINQLLGLRVIKKKKKKRRWNCPVQARPYDCVNSTTSKTSLGDLKKNVDIFVVGKDLWASNAWTLEVRPQHNQAEFVSCGGLT